MKEQTYTIKNITSFEPKHILECGQCFRWNIQKDGSYIGIVKQNVLQVKKEGNTIIFQSYGNDEIEKLCNQYFDLERDYEAIKNELTSKDKTLTTSIAYGSGIRILNQDLWEMIISFIISANNNIPRIKGIIEKIAKTYGQASTWHGQTYYTFPTPQELSKATIQELRNLGLGFRDTRVYETTQKIYRQEVDLQSLKKNCDTEQVREILLTLPGVGPKVADCILLFSNLKRLEVFPIDVWVRRVMNELYIQNVDETKVQRKQIEQLAIQKYGNLAGIAQQYLFYWKREVS